jgi:hypothetical protein
MRVCLPIAGFLGSTELNGTQSFNFPGMSAMLSGVLDVDFWSCSFPNFLHPAKERFPSGHSVDFSESVVPVPLIGAEDSSSPQLPTL